jgi:hypothetical protein
MILAVVGIVAVYLVLYVAWYVLSVGGNPTGGG